MKVLVVCDYLGQENNGTTIAAMNLIRYLRKQGDHVNILCCDQDKKGEKDTFVVPQRKFGFLIDYLIRANNVALAKPDKKVILKALEGVDIVHVIMPFALGTQTAKIARAKGIPVTCGFHCQAENFSAHIFNLMNSKLFNKLVYKNHYNRIYKRANAIHYPTKFIKDTFENTVKRKTNGYVISNGVNDIYKKVEIKERKPELSDKYNILFIGRISKEKSHYLLLKAVKLSKYKDNIRLIFAGQGPREKMVRKLEKRYKLNPILMDFYSRTELVEIINSCDLYVHPSEIEIEAISCLEAITCGLVPVISDSKRSATNAFALGEKNLFKYDSPKDLANKIDYWIEHPKEKAKCAKEYENFRHNFEQDECMRKMRNMLLTYAKKENHTNKTTYYFRDELNDDFALNGIEAKKIPSKFKYIKKDPVYKFFEFILYFIIAKPLVRLLNKIAYKQKFVNHLTEKKSNLKGAFIYANHTLSMGDAYTPNLIFHRRNNIIVGPEAFSIFGIRTIVKMLGGIPLPSTLEGSINFTQAIRKISDKNQHITIYPEAHIWPNYTEIRPFSAGSFRYPVENNKPSICLTNTFVPAGKKGNKFRLVTQIDGPFYPDQNLDKKEAREKLRNEIYECMCKRSKEITQFEKYKYINLEQIEVK